MATITLTLSAAHLTRLVDAHCGVYGYQAQIQQVPDGPFIPNPETRAEFARRKVIDDIKGLIREWERRVAIEAAVAPINPTPIDLT